MGHFKLAQGLSEEELTEIKELENICCQLQKLNMKLNWDMLETRSKAEINDILYYEDNRLVGFLGMYCIGQKTKEVEITGMVHPDYRCKGIFKNMFAEAKKHCKARMAERILLITERSSEAGIEFVNSIGAGYSFSEFRMKFEKEDIPSYPASGIWLQKASKDDYQVLMKLDEICFGKQGTEIIADQEISNYDSSYLVVLEGRTLGKIGITMDGNDGYVYGFGIKPEYRGKGHGREALCAALNKLRSENVRTILLEVAVKNENALSLYESCGFNIATVYDYYEILL